MLTSDKVLNVFTLDCCHLSSQLKDLIIARLLDGHLTKIMTKRQDSVENITFFSGWIKEC